MFERIRATLVDVALVAAALALFGLYAAGQLGHTVRFLLEWLTG